MPYTMRKIRGKDLYKVFNAITGEIKSEGSTRKDAKSQLRLLRGLEKKEAGSLKADQIKDVLDLSYTNEKDKAPEGYEIDKELSDGRVKVYKDLNSDQVIVAHRGSSGWKDWLDNAYYVTTGNVKNTDTYKKHQKKHEKALDKYGAENVIAVGHSRAGKYVEELNREEPVKEVLTYNKAVGLHDAFQKNPENQTDIRSSRDLISGLSPFQSSTNKVVTIPSNTYNFLKAHGTSALSSLGNKLIGKGFKQMRVGDMRKFVKAFKKAKYGETWIGGAKVNKKQLTEMIKPMLEDDDIDEMVGGSVWTDFVKDFSAKHFIKYACSLSKYKEPLKKAYKLFKDKKDWFEPFKVDAIGQTDTRKGKEPEDNITLVIEEKPEQRKNLSGGNKWTDFVKDYAKSYNTTYGCALSDVGIKGAYKLFKDGKTWFFPKVSATIETQTDEFIEPEPVKAPENIEPIVNRIDKKVRELEALGAKKGAVSYDSATFVTDIAFVNLLKKYGGKCIVNNIMKGSGVDLGIDLNNNPSKSDMRFPIHIKLLGEKLQDCIRRGVKLICIPLSLKFGTSTTGHANMLVYRPFKRIVERFEPHGRAFGSSMVDNSSFNKQLRQLWEKDLTPYIGEVRFREPDEICPNPLGFQALEGQLKGITNEGGGFCSMWSFFLAEMVFINPDKSTKEIIDEVFDITAKDPAYLKSVIRGYVVEVERELDELLKTMGKRGFSFGGTGLNSPFMKMAGSRKEFEAWILSVSFDSGKYSEAPPQFEPLPDVILKDKSDEDKLKELYFNKIKGLTIKQIKNIYGRYGLKGHTGKKDDMANRLVVNLYDGKLNQYGATGLEDLDVILEEQLYKDDKTLPKDYFIKKRDEREKDIASKIEGGKFDFGKSISKAFDPKKNGVSKAFEPVTKSFDKAGKDISKGISQASQGLNKINPMMIALNDKKTSKAMSDLGGTTNDYLIPAVVAMGKPVYDATAIGASTMLTGNPVLGKALADSLWDEMVAKKGIDPRDRQKSELLGAVSTATGNVLGKAMGNAF